MGLVLAACTEKGLCFVGLWHEKQYLLSDLKKRYPNANFFEEQNKLKTSLEVLSDYLEGQKNDLALEVDLSGTAFQKNVWLALRRVPYGETLSYTKLTLSMGLGAKSVRAVAHGCATNPVSLVIPCHRILRSDGSLGGYYWGLDRKRALLEMEGAVPHLLFQTSFI